MRMSAYGVLNLWMILNRESTMGPYSNPWGDSEKPSNVISVNCQATVVQAAATMKQYRVGCLVVTDDEERLVGILSERDIVRCVVAESIDPTTVSVTNIMTGDVACCDPETSMIQARAIMSTRNVRHLPVVADGVPVGMISSREVMAHDSKLARGTRDVTVFALAKLAESRDPDTGGHLERVCDYANVLARDLADRSPFSEQIDEDFILLLTATCPLHDIGKVGIPDHVLLKPGRLDDKEFAIMKTHSRRGSETLDLARNRYPQAGFLHMAYDIADSHHERFDGDGYPEGISGDDIPLSARIFALADVYDALVSRRVYKGAFTQELAESIIAEGRGTQFDPDVVDGFMRCRQAFHEIQEAGEAVHAVV